MPSVAEAGQGNCLWMHAFRNRNHPVRTIHPGIKKVLVLGIREQQSDRVATEIKADPAGLPDDDRRVRAGEIKPAFVLKVRISCGNNLGGLRQQLCDRAEYEKQGREQAPRDNEHMHSLTEAWGK